MSWVSSAFARQSLSGSGSSLPRHIDIAASSHPGKVRARNEDCFYVASATRALHTVLSSLAPGDVPEHVEETDYLMVVADGMGGHAAGDVASRMAISALVDLVLVIPDWIFRPDDAHTPEVQRRMRESVQRIGAALIERGRQDPALYGMGSTLTIARTCGRQLLITHVGDSRAYLFRDGGLERLTRDDTYAQRLVDIGQLSPRDVGDSGVNHILTNALGGASEEVDVAFRVLSLEDGDIVLLCSDGLTDCVDDDLIAATLAAERPAKEHCERLLGLALERGGRDNVTAIVAAFGASAAMSPRRGLGSLRAAANRVRDACRPRHGRAS